jgi:phosphoribosylformylglycinamidine synthase
MRAYLERVPLREPSMQPHEILASESQERMLLIVAPGDVRAVLDVCNKWGVLATAIGEVAEGDRLVISWHDQIIVDCPPGSLADDGPVYSRPLREPSDLILLQADRAETLPRPSTPEELRSTLLRLVSSPNLCDKNWITEQYDRYVLGNTVLAQPEDAGVLRLDEESNLGIALATDGNGRYARLDPYEGAKLALAEAYRNVSVTGAEPIAVTNCLNFGSPEDPAVMWQFAEAVRGLADGCLELGIPVTGGNVSFYNQTATVAINPTPVVGVLGILDNVTERVPMGFAAEGDTIVLLGATGAELSGSEWAWVVHGHLGGQPPKVDLAAERKIAGLLRQVSLLSAHDLSDGGLAQALTESVLRRGVGATVRLPGDPFIALFSESAGRVLVTVRDSTALLTLAETHDVPAIVLGTTGGDALTVEGQFSIPLDELVEAHAGTLPRLFG